MVHNKEREALRERFQYWCEKLRLKPGWEVALEWVEDASWRKNGDIKIDCDAKTAILMINGSNPREMNLEGVIVHELMHLKMYPLDQVTESLITSNFQEGTSAYDFAYTQFFTALEQTVEELTKCFLLEFGENHEISFGRCRSQKSFNELYDGLKNLG